MLIPALAAAIAAYFTLRGTETRNRLRRTPSAELTEPNEAVVLPGWLPRSPIVLGLLLLIVGGTFMSVMTNPDPLVYGDLRIPGQRPYDAMAALLSTAVMLLPLMLGRKFLAAEDSHRTLLVILCTAALVYSLPALYEVRMSPQINQMVYGFFPHEWLQHIRGGGFRPLVFLDHGLLLGIFLACAIVGTAILVRLSSAGWRLAFVAALLYLFFVLFMFRNLGALLIALIVTPLAFLLPVRLQLLAAAVVAGIALTYPMLRGAAVVPTEEIVELARSVDEDRSRSVAFRFRNEYALLAKASERPLFGWAGWGRWLIYDENGNRVSVPDGQWIIDIAQWGWVGYIARFGLLTFPMILLFLRKRYYNVGLATSGLSLMVAANVLDLLPNAAPSPVLWLAVGALFGRLEMKKAEMSVPEAASVRSGREGPRYSRFPHKPRREPR
jgi:hypothetical protein